MNLLSALLLILSYPSFNLWWLAWFALVPLFISLSKANSHRGAFVRGYLFGILFWAGTIWWVGHVTIFGALMLMLYLSLYSGIFAWIFYRLWRSEVRGLRFVLFISTIWTLLEWFRSHLFTGFGWNLLAYSQAPNLLLIQIADLVGALGVSFLVVWVNGVIFLPVRRMGRGSEKLLAGAGHPPSGGSAPRESARILLLTLLMATVVLGYGFYRLNERIPTQPISIAVIQGNVPQNIKWEEQYRSMLFERYEILTKTASLDHPGLILWPETSIVEDFSNPEIQNRIAGIAREANSFLLVGAPWASQTAPTSYYNSAILFDPQGNLVQKYDKLHLVPYGEFIPFEKQFPFQRNWIITGDFIGGKEYTVFNIPNSQLPAPSTISFSVLICFEDVFPDVVRHFVRRGARLLINISNDAWFHESGAPFQHAQASVFRAVENRVPVVRATNTGFSCFIDSRGRIYEKVPPFKTGYLTARLEIPST